MCMHNVGAHCALISCLTLLSNESLSMLLGMFSQESSLRYAGHLGGGWG